MQIWTIEADGALEKGDDLEPKSETYFNRMKETSFILETTSEEAYERFNEMPAITLPPLPWGYLWTYNPDGKYCIIRDEDTFEHAFNLIIFGPNGNNQINFLFQMNDVTTYSFAHTVKGAGLTGCAAPMSYSDYRVPDYNYSNGTYRQHVRGHLIDQHDTIKFGLRNLWSTFDPRNFIPEPPKYEWGSGIRNQKVRALRRLPYPTAYAQYSLYPDHPSKTNNKTWIPEEAFFTSFSIQGNIYERLDCIDVNWEENLKRPSGQKILEHAEKKLTSSLNATPVVEIIEPTCDARLLRRESYSHARTANFIAQGTYRARFSSCEMFKRFNAADKEVEHINYQLHATRSSDKANRISDSIQNLVRSLNNGEQLVQLDKNDKLVPDSERRSSLNFFKSKQDDDDWADQDLDNITDRLNSIWKP